MNINKTHRRRESGRGPGDMIKTMQAPRRGAKLGHRRLSAKVPRRGTPTEEAFITIGFYVTNHYKQSKLTI